MRYIKLTSKRQATLPKELCEEMNVVAGDSLLVERKVVNGQAVWYLQPVRDLDSPWFGALGKYAADKSHDLGDIRQSLADARGGDVG